MLTRLQSEYAGQPVRFLLIPCNQFGAQEPDSNAVVKVFAEKYVKLGPDSNVVMLAKSNLNGVACTYSGPDVCTPASKECCPKNNAVYDYLLANTAPGTITWNFDKIFTGVDGRPYDGETIFHGGDTDAVVKAVVGDLMPAGSLSLVASGHESDVAGAATHIFLAGLFASAALYSLSASKPHKESSELSAGDEYIRIA